MSEPDIFAEIDAALTPEERAAEVLTRPGPVARDWWPAGTPHRDAEVDLETQPDRYAALAAKWREEAARVQSYAGDDASGDLDVARAATFLACAQMLEHVHGGAR